jgi:2,5-diketo-D-gluconate reductase B
MSDRITTPILSIPRLGFGTWRLSGAEAQAAVESALGLGYRAVDTAEMYGNEVEVGAGLKASGLPRDDIFLTSKVWPTHLGAGEIPRSTDSARITSTSTSSTGPRATWTCPA